MKDQSKTKQELLVQKAISFILLVSVFLLLNIPLSVIAKDSKYKTTPLLNNGKKWRIGYYEGGPYINYPANLITLVKGLNELGWMGAITINTKKNPTDSRVVWDELSKAKSKYIQFVPDAYWSANWDKTVRVKNTENAIKRLQSGDIDFMVAMGTWAGQDLANNNHSVPTMVVSASDPVQSNIVKSAEDSGNDHVHAKCDPTRYINQIKLFHNMFNFKKLGIVYENSVEGRSYAAIADVEKVAKDRGFEIVKCEAPASGVEEKESVKAVILCHEELAPKVDAVYVTVHRGIVSEHMPEILAPLYKHKIPTFSMRGPEEVEKGVLLSISRDMFVSVGKYHAGIMARIFNGAKPRELNQIFMDPKTIVVNIKTAEIIGHVIPPAFLKVTDKVYSGVHPEVKSRN
ncbi:MAG: ABC transporter substrate-binding protein [Proteobacteria bacterium]|nr:ABC transporter substrate-binding protein [Pseudomonadota bacterium]